MSRRPQYGIEADFFAKWQANDPRHLVFDGCVDPETWRAQSVRVVFILKEVNHEGSPHLTDLRRALYEGPASRQLGRWPAAGEPQPAPGSEPGRGLLDHTWNNVLRWLYGIVSGPIEPWTEFSESVNVPNTPKWLRRLCAVNINKGGGGTVADKDVIKRAAAQDEVRLREQLALYPEADFFVCCGTGEHVRTRGLLESAKPRRGKAFRWQYTRRGIGYHDLPDGRTVVRYCHPKARASAPLVVYPLIDAVHELQARELRHR